MNKKENVIKNNLGLVHSCAKKFKNRGIEYDDLFQSGCIGLIKATEGFDETRGFKFSTYAVPVILGEIKLLFRNGGSIKVSRDLKSLSLKIKNECELFFIKYNREPSINELSKTLQTEPEKIVQALNSSVIPTSLTQNSEDGENQIDIPIPAIEEKLTEALSLNESIQKLNSKDRALILLRFFQNKTQTQTAKKLGMTQVQVSRREKVILKNLRSQLKE